MTAQAHTHTKIAALEAQWWKDWWAADYSWDGLKAKEGPEGTANMQDFWRGEAEHLIPEPGTKRRWTRLHCPLHFAVGTPSPKAAWSATAWQALYADVLAPRTEGHHSVLLLAGGVIRDLRLTGWNTDAHKSILAAGAYVSGQVQLSLTNPLHTVDMANAWINACLLDGPSPLHAGIFRADGATFVHGLSAPHSVLTGASFKNAHFYGELDFRNVRFDGVSNFTGARIAGNADFSKASFADYVHFTKARFAGLANFYGCRFQGRALFDHVECLDDIGFFKAAFVRRLTINDARFYGSVNLEGVADGDPISQAPQSIHLTASGDPPLCLTGTLDAAAGPTARNYNSLPKLQARRTTFYELANFSNRDLLSPSTFRDAVFHEKALFYGSDIHASVNFFGTDFRRALTYHANTLPRYPEDLLVLRSLAHPDLVDYRDWKKAYLKTRIDRRKTEFTADNYYNNLESCFRTLKQMMEERRDRLNEGEFFNLELRARRKRSDVPLWERFTSYLYWLVSDYGNSVFRPLVVLVTLFGIMGGLYYALGLLPHFAGQPLAVADGYGVPNLLKALTFSLQNVFAPFSVLDTSKFNPADPWVAKVVLSDNPAFGLLVKLLASTQSLVSLSLAFLAGLAGRRRFQIN